MKIVNHVRGKEVVDGIDGRSGLVKNLEWNFKVNRIDSLIFKEPDYRPE